jgi:hypothetical protein
MRYNLQDTHFHKRHTYSHDALFPFKWSIIISILFQAKQEGTSEGNELSTITSHVFNTRYYIDKNHLD